MLGGGLARGLINKAIAAAAAAGAAFVAIAALGAAIYFALCMVVPPLAAAAITAVLFALVALIIILVFVRSDADEEEDEEPEGLAQRAFTLFRERPILGAVAAIAGGFIFLKNPALATMVTAAFTEKPQSRRRYR